MNKKVKRVLIGSSVAAAGITALGTLSYAATKYLVKIAMERELPKVKNLNKAKDQVRGFEDVDAFYNNLENACQTLENCGCETVAIEWE